MMGGLSQKTILGEGHDNRLLIPPDFAPPLGLKQGKIVPAAGDGSASEAGRLRPGGNTILARANKAKVDLAKAAARRVAAATAAVAAGGDGGGHQGRVRGRRPTSDDPDLIGDGVGQPYNEEELGMAVGESAVATRFMAVDGGSRPLAVESLPNTRPFYPRRREEGVPANEEEAGNLAAVLRRCGEDGQWAME